LNNIHKIQHHCAKNSFSCRCDKQKQSKASKKKNDDNKSDDDRSLQASLHGSCGLGFVCTTRRRRRRSSQSVLLHQLREVIDEFI